MSGTVKPVSEPRKHFPGWWIPVLLLLLFSTASAREDVPHSMLIAHNAVRDSLDLPPLRWSNEMAVKATIWAHVLIDQRAFFHDSDDAHGQNLYQIVGGEASSAMVVEAWASEAASYDYATGTCSSKCGHYTQIVWRDTTDVGCGMAQGGERQIWVCDYSPPGNYRGERPY